MFADEREESFKGRIVFVSPLVEPGGDFRVWAEVENRKKESVEWLASWSDSNNDYSFHSTTITSVHRTVTTADAE